MKKSIIQKPLSITVIICTLVFVLFLFSCSKNIASQKDKNKLYTFDILYIYDNGLPAFTPSAFRRLFEYEVPMLAKKILGYDIAFNITAGMTDKEFYDRTKSIIYTNVSTLKEYHLNIFNTPLDEVYHYTKQSLFEYHPFRLEYLFNTTNIEQIANEYSTNNYKNVISILNMKLPNRETLFDNNYPFF